MIDLNSLPLPTLFDELTVEGSLGRLLAAAVDEDLDQHGDVTSASIIDPQRQALGHVIMREAGIVSGLPVVPRVAAAFKSELHFRETVADGEPAAKETTICIIEGNARHLLTMERTLLDLLGRMCGVATMTRRFIDAIEGTDAVICDTRKTMPGLRALDKYAVRCGGGTLHRVGLYDAALYKDNHLAHLDADSLAEELTRAVGRAREAHDLRFVEVEVDTIDQLRRVLEIEDGVVDMLLLDNMPNEALREAVVLRDRQRPKILLEASGGVHLETVLAIAGTGVDRISVGALTHSAPWLDVGMDFQ